MSSARVKEFPGQKAKVEVHFTNDCPCDKIAYICDWASYEKEFIVFVDEDDKKNFCVPYSHAACILISPVDKDVDKEEELRKFNF